MDTAGGTQPAEAGWDFFVSYTAADQAWAEWVARELEAAGHRVLFQTWDFVPGSHWTTRMQEDVAGAARTLAILSRAYLNSVYRQEEWEAVHRTDPQGFTRKVIPLRVEECDRPDLLGGVVTIRHRGRVNAVAFSPDGALLATASSDRTVHLWQLGGHKPSGGSAPPLEPASFVGQDERAAVQWAEGDRVGAADDSDLRHRTDQETLPSTTQDVAAPIAVGRS